MAFIVMLAVHTLYTICFDSSSSSSGSGRTLRKKMNWITTWQCKQHMDFTYDDACALALVIAKSPRSHIDIRTVVNRKFH